ncbi:uncharacterized protein CLUP02_08594 [Colletotrichum lupini]|uniref:Uncharacterized protein n=1 Tax=Colletotrichum lupini TaxID=145971 RepID=A0A9Q8ST89_9PEZI|nr:uncharacterized protein CLUP02_08594 [Colletotrichum lupini]UQC83101.1 hypothetical protein CLUP02_08594 [Colletotrichum lupini]
MATITGHCAAVFCFWSAYTKKDNLGYMLCLLDILHARPAIPTVHPRWIPTRIESRMNRGLLERSSVRIHDLMRRVMKETLKESDQSRRISRSCFDAERRILFYEHDWDLSCLQ